MHRLKYILVFIVSILLILPANDHDVFASSTAKRAKKGIIKGKSSKSKKKVSTKKRKKRRSKRSYVLRETGPYLMLLVKDSVISNGLSYKNYLMGRGKAKHSVHVIETDISDPANSLLVLKANNSASDLVKLHDIVRNTDELEFFDIMGAINANFWQAFSNRPIGPTIVDGEVIEMVTHKNWSSAFFDADNKMHIGNIRLSGFVYDSRGREYSVSSVNRRKENMGLVLYNHFAGDTLPIVKNIDINKALDEAIRDSLFDVTDSTEAPVDTMQIRQEIINLERSTKTEYPLKKIVCVYLYEPAINKKIPCRIVKVDTGAVAIPNNGCVLSLGSDFTGNKFGEEGDILYLKFETNEYKDHVFYNAVAGTPRLVRNGDPTHEAVQEGSRSRRFIHSQLARTAIGTDECNEIIYLVAVEPSSEGKSGASLAQLSQIMKRIGAHNAMNLDGGGSSIMLMDNRNLLRASRPDFSRKISVALAAARRRIIPYSSGNSGVFIQDKTKKSLINTNQSIK